MALNVKNIKSDIGNMLGALRFVYQSSKRLFLLRFVFIIVQSLLPLASLYLLKLLVDGVTNVIAHPEAFPVSSLWLSAALFCGVFALIRLTGIFAQLTDDVSVQKLIDYISNLLHDKSTELDLEFFDNPAFHDIFHRARQEAYYRPFQLLNNITGILISGLSLIGTLAVLLSFSSLGVAVIIIAGLPSLLSKLAKSKVMFNFRKSNTPLSRKADYLSKLMTDREYAKEIRVFNLAGYFKQRFITIREKFVSKIVSISAKRSKLDALAVIIESLALLFVIILLSNQAFAGAITIGSFVMFFEAFRRGQSYVQGLVSGFTGIYENKLFLNNLFEFLKLKPVILSPEKPIPFPSVIKEGIRFDNVSFFYPGSDKKVIEHLSFNAKPGEVLILKGENGSGKTTLIKLLCRLYDCSVGAVYIDGINIRDYDLKVLRKNISVMFQDFAKYDFTARESIALGDIENHNDTAKLHHAALMSNSEKIINELPLKYDTILGKYFENGEELSMGQYQRIALARALYSSAPILVLDEPTTWQDPDSESLFYQNLNRLKENKIIFLVSHSADKKLNYSNSYSVNKTFINKQLILN